VLRSEREVLRINVPIQKVDYKEIEKPIMEEDEPLTYDTIVNSVRSLDFVFGKVHDTIKLNKRR
jgi:hypothetical protein